jgi:hypothetical protein
LAREGEPWPRVAQHCEPLALEGGAAGRDLPHG